jgi:hypothetical protein
MPDWNALVRERLGAADSSSVKGEEAEIVAELAAHLEDFYEELCGRGMCESDAIDRALGDIGDWRGMAARIRLAKGEEETMNYRTRALWLPGLIGLTASMVWLMILQRATLKPSLPGPWLHAGVAFMPYLVWQITQPLFGAASACLSRRAGAERRTELAATLFPAIVILGVWVVLVACIVVTRYSHVVHQWPLVIAGTLNWSIFPGLSLLLGRFLYLKTQTMAKP